MSDVIVRTSKGGSWKFRATTQGFIELLRTHEFDKPPSAIGRRIREEPHKSYQKHTPLGAIATTLRRKKLETSGGQSLIGLPH